MLVLAGVRVHSEVLAIQELFPSPTGYRNFIMPSGLYKMTLLRTLIVLWVILKIFFIIFSLLPCNLLAFCSRFYSPGVILRRRKYAWEVFETRSFEPQKGGEINFGHLVPLTVCDILGKKKSDFFFQKLGKLKFRDQTEKSPVRDETFEYAKSLQEKFSLKKLFYLFILFWVNQIELQIELFRWPQGRKLWGQVAARIGHY